MDVDGANSMHSQVREAQEEGRRNRSLGIASTRLTTTKSPEGSGSNPASMRTHGYRRTASLRQLAVGSRTGSVTPFVAVTDQKPTLKRDPRVEVDTRHYQLLQSGVSLAVHGVTLQRSLQLRGVHLGSAVQRARQLNSFTGEEDRVLQQMEADDLRTCPAAGTPDLRGSLACDHLF